MAKGGKAASSGVEAQSLPLGAERAKSAEDAELDAMIAEEEAAKVAASSESPAPCEGCDDPAHGHEPPKGLDAPPESGILGPTARVWDHGGLDWNSLSLKAGEVFVVDTTKCKREEFERLVELGVLLPVESK
jgi:hypothetical protein